MINGHPPTPMSKTNGSLLYGATVTELRSHRNTHYVYTAVYIKHVSTHKPLLHVVHMHIVYSSRRGVSVRSETKTGFTARSW